MEEIITDVFNIDDKNYFTIARVIENDKCVELHYNNGIASVEFGRKDKNNLWYDEIEEVKWFNRNLTNEQVLRILNKKFNEYFKK